MADTTTCATVGWFPVFTAFAGLVTSPILQWLQDRRTSRREHEAREAARREQRFERRTNFQRQTLLDLQEAAMKVIQTTGEMHFQDMMANRTGGEWRKQLYGEDLDNRDREANAQTTKLTVRVRDEMVRKLVKEVKDASSATLFARSQPEAEQAIQNMATVFEKLNERIGELLRKLDDDEDLGPGE